MQHIQYILRLKVSDTQCGLKGFGDIGKKVFLETKTDTFLFDLEFLLISQKTKLDIYEQAVVARKNIVLTNFKSKVLIKELYNFILLCFRY